MYRFNTVLIGIWLSLLHPVVSPDNVKPEVGGVFQELKTWARFRAGRMVGSPAVGDRANW